MAISRFKKFQFHKVQLKAIFTLIGETLNLMFQFHKVQLKVSCAELYTRQ